MLVKLNKMNAQNYHITVEDLETGQKFDLTCPIAIFQRVQKWGVGSFMEVYQSDGVVQSVVRRDPLDSQGAYA